MGADSTVFMRETRLRKEKKHASDRAVLLPQQQAKKERKKKGKRAGLTGERNGAHPPVHRKKRPVLVEGRIAEGVPVEAPGKDKERGLRLGVDGLDERDEGTRRYSRSEWAGRTASGGVQEENTTLNVCAFEGATVSAHRHLRDLAQAVCIWGDPILVPIHRVS